MMLFCIFWVMESVGEARTLSALSGELIQSEGLEFPEEVEDALKEV